MYTKRIEVIMGLTSSNMNEVIMDVSSSNVNKVIMGTSSNVNKVIMGTSSNANKVIMEVSVKLKTDSIKGGKALNAALKSGSDVVLTNRINPLGLIWRG